MRQQWRIQATAPLPPAMPLPIEEQVIEFYYDLFDRIFTQPFSRGITQRLKRDAVKRQVEESAGAASQPGFPFWILASSILRSFSLEGKPFLTAGTHRAGPKCALDPFVLRRGPFVGRKAVFQTLLRASLRFRTRERPFYPLGSGSAQILCSMSPNSLRFRCPSANNNQ